MKRGRRLDLAMAMLRETRARTNAGLQLSHPHLTPPKRRLEIADRWWHARS